MLINLTIIVSDPNDDACCAKVVFEDASAEKALTMPEPIASLVRSYLEQVKGLD